MENDNKQLSRGPLYPVYLSTNENGETGWYVSNDQNMLIQNNITSILSFELGQRIHQEDFGTRLWECLEEPNTQALNFLVNTFIKEALSKWEDRIEYQRSEIIRDHHKLYIKFFYKLRSNNALESASVFYDLDYEK